MNDSANQNVAAVIPRRWFNFGPRMSKARLLIVLVGVVLPFAARIPGMITQGVNWFTSYWTGWHSFLFFGTFNSICWGSILLATLTYRDVRSVWFPALIGFAMPAYWHATLDIASSNFFSAIKLSTIPFLSLPYVGVGWLVGLAFDRLVFNSPAADANAETGQFRLRSLMIVTAAIAVLCGLFAYERRRVKAMERNAVRQTVLDGRFDPELARGILGDEVDALKAELEKKKIEAIAVADAIKRMSLSADRLEVTARQQGDQWRVTVWRLPATPGERYTLIISKSGEITEFIGGE
jgi:hypothetical protein